MDLEIYKGVIRRAYDRSKAKGESSEAFYAHLIDSLEIANDLMGAGISSPVKAAAPILQMPGKASIAEPAMSQPSPRGAIISAAPPVAGADTTEEDDGDVDHWESRPGKGDGCTKLETFLKTVLPSSITVQLPNFAQPLELSRGVGGPGLKFVFVTYSIPGSQELGPRYTIMTSVRASAIDKDAILEDIVAQATAMYSSEKRQIVPQAVASPGMPSNQDLERALQRDRSAQQPNDGVVGEDARQAAETAREWGSNRSSRW